MVFRQWNILLKLKEIWSPHRFAQTIKHLFFVFHVLNDSHSNGSHKFQEIYCNFLCMLYYSVFFLLSFLGYVVSLSITVANALTTGCILFFTLRRSIVCDFDFVLVCSFSYVPVSLPLSNTLFRFYLSLSRMCFCLCTRIGENEIFGCTVQTNLSNWFSRMTNHIIVTKIGFNGIKNIRNLAENRCFLLNCQLFSFIVFAYIYIRWLDGTHDNSEKTFIFRLLKSIASVQYI